LTAVIIGGEEPHSRAIAAALDAGLWNVGETSAGGRAIAAVAVVDRVKAQDAPAVVANAQAAGDAVIVVIGEPTVEAIRALLQAGADAVIPSESVETQLGPAMTAVQAGLATAPRGTLSQALGRPALTPREKQALGMVVLGFSNADIANKLYVAESTVKSHLSSAFTKLGVRTRSEATALILDRSNGLGTGILAIVGDGDADTA
jgi:DNA-binding NarL/FixJ family response regulator